MDPTLLGLYHLREMTKEAIGPRTLALLKRPSAMRKLDQIGVTSVLAKGRKVAPGKAREALRASRQRVARGQNRNAYRTTYHQAVNQPKGLKENVGRVADRVTMRDMKFQKRVPKSLRDTEAATRGFAQKDKLRGIRSKSDSAARARGQIEGRKGRGKHVMETLFPAAGMLSA